MNATLPGAKTQTGPPKRACLCKKLLHKQPGRGPNPPQRQQHL
jgi:hypothetical protein